MDKLLQNLQNVLNEALTNLSTNESNKLTELKDVLKDAHKFNNMSEDEQIIITDACTSIIESHIYESGAAEKIAKIIDDYHAVTPDPCDRPTRFDGDIILFIKSKEDNSNWMAQLSLDIIRPVIDRGNELDASVDGFIDLTFIKLPKGVTLENDIDMVCTVEPWCFESDDRDQFITVED